MVLLLKIVMVNVQDLDVMLHKINLQSIQQQIQVKYAVFRMKTAQELEYHILMLQVL
jgi:hypothetical protein